MRLTYSCPVIRIASCEELLVAFIGVLSLGTLCCNPSFMLCMRSINADDLSSSLAIQPFNDCTSKWSSLLCMRSINADDLSSSLAIQPFNDCTSEWSSLLCMRSINADDLSSSLAIQPFNDCTSEWSSLLSVRIFRHSTCYRERAKTTPSSLTEHLLFILSKSSLMILPNSRHSLQVRDPVAFALKVAQMMFSFSLV